MTSMRDHQIGRGGPKQCCRAETRGVRFSALTHRPGFPAAACNPTETNILTHAVPNAAVQQGFEIRGDLVELEDVFNAVKKSGKKLPLDATEPRLVPLLNDIGPEDEMAVRLSHVPQRVHYGI